MKTDRRDARTLAEALRLGAYRLAHRVSPERRHVRAELAVREALVRTRTRSIALAKTLVRRDGLRVAPSEPHLVAKRIAALEVSDRLAAELLPLFTVLAPLLEEWTRERRNEQGERETQRSGFKLRGPAVGAIGDPLGWSASGSTALGGTDRV